MKLLRKNQLLIASICFLCISSIVISSNAATIGEESENVEISEVFTEVDLFGYQIHTTFQSKIVNISGDFDIYQKVGDFVEVSINIGEERISLSDVKVTDKSVSIFDNGTWLGETTYFSDYGRGIFFEIHEYSDYIWFNFAFGYGESQYIFDAIIEPEKKMEDILLNEEFQNTQIEETIDTGTSMNRRNISTALTEISNWQRESLIVYHGNELLTPQEFSAKDSSLPSSSSQDMTPRSATSQTTYSIIHECINIDTDLSDVAEDILSTMTDYAIRRYNPTESQVKSDLSYYSEDRYNGAYLQYKRDLIYYEIVAHGEEDQWTLYGNRHWSWYHYVWDEIGEITNNELLHCFDDAEVGSYYYDRDVDNAVCLAFACDSLDDAMSGVWLSTYYDVNGWAFVGTHTAVSVYASQVYSTSEKFWTKGQEGDTLENAVKAICTVSIDWTYPTVWDYET
ncbi:MAG: hypothetical protein ACTSWL_08615 [Promethearchaeota archaeon]